MSGTWTIHAKKRALIIRLSYLRRLVDPFGDRLPDDNDGLTTASAKDPSYDFRVQGFPLL